MADRAVSPTGSGSAATLAAPSSLSDAFNNSNGVTINAGEIVWMRGDPTNGTSGTYTNSNADPTPKYTLNISGSASAPIIYRPWPGERVIVDSYGGVESPYGFYLGLNNPANNVIFYEIEFTNTEVTRTGCVGAGVCPGGALSNHAWTTNNVKFINCIFHDCGQSALGAFPPANSSTYVYGNLFYYNGSHTNQMHNIYWNDFDNTGTGGKVFMANIGMYSNGYGWHFYGDHNRFRVQFNTSACSGRMSSTGSGGNLLLGHDIAGVSGPTTNGLVDSNYEYQPDNTGFSQLLGYEVGWDNVIYSNNRGVGADYRFYNVQNRNNTFNNNNLQGNFFTNGVSGVPTVIGTGNTFTNDGSRPGSGTEAYLVPNIWEPGRCNVTIYNWDHANTVNVNLASGGVRVGDDYAVYWWPKFATKVACLTGTYAGGNVAFPMTTGVLGAMPNPTWDGGFQPPVTCLPEFSPFIVRTITRRN